MDGSTNGGYAVHASSDMQSPPKSTRPRKKYDDDSEFHHVQGSSRKRQRRDKDVEGQNTSIKAEDRDRSNMGERLDQLNSNGNSSSVASLPSGSVLFLTPSGREEITSGRSLLELIRRTSRVKSKRREDRAEDLIFAVDDTMLVPNSLTEKIDSKFRDDVIGKIVVEHTKNWIKLSGFGKNREFIQNFTQVVQPRYPCSHPTILDEVLVSFLFKRPEFAESLIKPLIRRLTFNNEQVAVDKNPLIRAMSRKIGSLRHRSFAQDSSHMCTRHRIASLAIVKTLLEGNSDQLLNAWIHECLAACSDDLIHVVVTNLTNSLTYLTRLQPESHQLKWLDSWQKKDWNIHEADRQINALVQIEETSQRSHPGPVTKAVVRDALVRFGNNPHGILSLFSDSLRIYFAHATTRDSYLLLDESFAKFPPRYPNDNSYKHPVVATIELFSKVIPMETALDYRWFHGHLWPYLISHWDLDSIQLVLREHLSLVFGPSDQVHLSSLEIWQALLGIVTSLETIPSDKCRQLFDLWIEEWSSPQHKISFHQVIHMSYVAIGLQQVMRIQSSKTFVALEFARTAKSIRQQFLRKSNDGLSNLTWISWLLQSVLKGHGGIEPTLCANFIGELLEFIPQPIDMPWKRMLQRIIHSSLIVDDSMTPITSVSFFDWQSGRVIPFPLPSSTTTTSIVIYHVHILMKLIQRHCKASSILREELQDTRCFNFLLQLTKSTNEKVLIEILTLLFEILPISIEKSMQWTNDITINVFFDVIQYENKSSLIAMDILNRLAFLSPENLLETLLHQCTSLKFSKNIYPTISNIVKQCIYQCKNWNSIYFFIKKNLLCGYDTWYIGSIQHISLDFLRHLCHIHLRKELIPLILYGINTIKTTCETICLLQLDIILWIVSNKKIKYFKNYLNDLKKKLNYLIQIPKRNVSTINAMILQILQCLDGYIMEEIENELKK